MKSVNQRQSGFSLIELMIVVVIVAIIAGVAYPAYTRQVQATQEERAKGDMMAALTSAEAHRAQRFSYQGFALSGAMLASAHYNYQLNIDANNQGFTILAFPIGSQVGAGALGINNRGQTCKGADAGCVPGSNPWK